jgi:DNA invertase Pin-like site-specific DNA recombinase
MLRIGYVRPRDADSAAESAALKSAGCQVVRAEEPALHGYDDFAVLNSIIDFIGEGDQLVVASLDQLGSSGRSILSALEQLEARGASLYVLQPDLCSQGAGGKALRAALEAVAAVEPAHGPRVRRPAAAEEIRALQQAGLGPVEIARRLGVSRMTVWRKLKAVGA